MMGPHAPAACYLRQPVPCNGQAALSVGHDLGKQPSIEIEVLHLKQCTKRIEGVRPHSAATQVTVLERMSEAGRKILISGGTRW